MAHVLRAMFGILSGPIALDGFMFFSRFSTPATVISRFCIVDPAHCGSTVVEIFGFGFVKTDLNWLFKISAFSLLSFVNPPDLLSGTTPIL